MNDTDKIHHLKKFHRLCILCLLRENEALSNQIQDIKTKKTNQIQYLKKNVLLHI